ncbi:amidohydrolase [Kordiimonas sp. SCSIO 12610]|uniref:amidohydrolase n=1 Tax=Kordiimonas sp. SCSIO 12610 TaxID=2829597 RepID=UPI00210D9643|nr:amidohydrolase [Kordiimonas sp. SCSIO 12610]UTW55113.1 amidohydrolase [Kordiimonas sp. SCSIO 12610]
MRFIANMAAVYLLIAAAISSVSAQSEIADTVIWGGPIYTADDANPEAEAIAIKDGRFVFVGSRSEVQAFVGDTTTVLSLDGAALFPGFVDAHAHLLGIGERELTLNLEGSASLSDFVEKVKAWREAHDDAVIVGRGWIETHWPENRTPSRWDIDDVVADIPVILKRADGHAVVANSKALEMAGISGATEAPFGGEIHKNALNEPTGILVDAAMGLVNPLIPATDTARITEALKVGGDVYAEYGWAGLHSMSVSWPEVLAMESLSDTGDLGIRVYNSINPGDASNLFAGGARVSNSGTIITKAIKLYMDGALGSRGAALLEPYSDADTHGLITIKEEDALPIMEQALRNGIQMNIHAIGDRGNRQLLDWYEQIFAKVDSADRAVVDPRWRIEHAQIVHPDDIPRFRNLGVIPSMQPSHAIGDLHFAPDRLGDDRLLGAYAWQSLIASGVIVPGGSDAPVERGDPLIEFYAATARRDLKGFQGQNWHAEEAVSREDALKMFTLWPAMASFTEDEQGTITVGKKADLTAFDIDIMSVDEADIPKGRAVLTMVDGKIIFVDQETAE